MTTDSAFRQMAGYIVDKWLGTGMVPLMGIRATDCLRDAIETALAVAWAQGRDAAARWHDNEAAITQAACDAAWVECTPDLGLRAVAEHRRCAAAIRALTPAAVPSKENG